MKGREGFMTRQESIDLADRLEQDLAKLETLQKELHQNTLELDRPYTPRRKMRSGDRFSFNWYPIIGLLVSVPVLFFALMFYLYYFALQWDQKPGAGFYHGLSIAMVFLAIAVFIGIQVIGNVRNNAEIDRFNEGVDREHRNREEKRLSLKKRNKEIEQEILDLQKTLPEDFENIPQRFRTRMYMHQVKRLLLTEKAEDFEGAITLLRYSKNESPVS